MSVDAGSPGRCSVNALVAPAMELRNILIMKAVRDVIVFDAADLHAESVFWAGMLGGHVFEDETWHSVIDAAGEWRIGVKACPKPCSS